MAAWEPKSLHKLHCYLGQTSVSKHVADLEPQLPTLSWKFVLHVCITILLHTHTCMHKKMHCCNDINNEHSFMSHTVQQQETDGENSLNVFLFLWADHKRSWSQQLHNVLGTHLVWSNINYPSVWAQSMWLWMVCVCARAYVGGPPKSLLVFHDILQTPCLWFYTSKTHRELFLSQTYNLTVLLFFFLYTSFSSILLKLLCDCVRAIIKWMGWFNWIGCLKATLVYYLNIVSHCLLKKNLTRRLLTSCCHSCSTQTAFGCSTELYVVGEQYIVRVKCAF